MLISVDRVGSLGEAHGRIVTVRISTIVGGEWILVGIRKAWLYLGSDLFAV